MWYFMAEHSGGWISWLFVNEIITMLIYPDWTHVIELVVACIIIVGANGCILLLKYFIHS